jgi:cytochrome c
VDSFEWNKIAGGVLAALLIAMGASTVAGGLMSVHQPEKKGMTVDTSAFETAAAAGPEKEEIPLATLLASADAAKGANEFKKCATCHTIEKGGANKTGPNLYGIIGAKHAHIAGFAYSDAMKALADKPWNWDEMDQFIANPKGYIKGTKMAFAGIGKGENRANLLLYLNQNSDSPIPLPPPPAPKAVAEAALAAEGAAAPAAEAAAAPAAADKAAEAAPAPAAAK